MSKALKAFETTVEMFNKYANKPNDIGEFFKYTTSCSYVEKALKALEIIKDHGVDVAEIMICQDYAQYESWFCENVKGRVKLNKKEYDLLKEVLWGD